MERVKRIQIVAGPNGSGKTTFAESFFLKTQGHPVFLNPDLIASGIAPLDFERASFAAGRILISEVKARIGKGEGLGFESTLSGKTWLSLLLDARKKGYFDNSGRRPIQVQSKTDFDSLIQKHQQKYAIRFVAGRP